MAGAYSTDLRERVLAAVEADAVTGRRQRHACGHNTSRRVKMGATTSVTNHHHRRTAPPNDDDDGQGSRYLAQVPTRPRLVFQDSPSSETALRGRQIALGCDFVAPSVTSI